MNQNISIVAGMLPNSGDGIQQYSIATIQDLKTLKHRKPNCTIRYADITPQVKQNCDATVRVLSTSTLEDLSRYVPESGATQLYIQAAVWTHEPYRNKFGPPPAVVRSLWAGLMTWRRWRQYIQICDGLFLTHHFISRAHYLTEELIVHAGINHQLVLYLCFPELDVKQYSMRNTGNRGIEAIHGIFRGGSNALPITSANLSFREFLDRMNKMVQVRQAQQKLQQIEGNSMQATKMKKLTYAHVSTDPERSVSESYKKPSTFRGLLMELSEACNLGDEDSQRAIEKLSPNMAKSLKEVGEWRKPKLGLEHSDMTKITLVTNEECFIQSHPPTYIFERLMEAE